MHKLGQEWLLNILNRPISEKKGKILSIRDFKEEILWQGPLILVHSNLRMRKSYMIN